MVAGFAAFKNHLAYLPHSGSVLPVVADAIEGYERTAGSLHFAINRPLPKTLVKRLIAVRMREIPARAAGRRGRRSRASS